MDDRKILKKVKNGDVDAYGTIVERYHRPILRFINTMTRDPFLSEDIGQMVFLSFFKALESYDEDRDTPVSAWLFVAARNLTVNTLKKNARHLPWDEKTASVKEQKNYDPGEIFIKEEDRRTLEKCLAQLEEPFRTTLRESLQGATIKEIAANHRIATGTVKSRLSRAKEKCIALFKARLKEVKNG